MRVGPHMTTSILKSSKSYDNFRLRMRKCKILETLITSVKDVKMFSNFHERLGILLWRICMSFEEIGFYQFGHSTGHAQNQIHSTLINYSAYNFRKVSRRKLKFGENMRITTLNIKFEYHQSCTIIAACACANQQPTTNNHFQF